MSDRPLWFDGSIIGAVFSLVIMPAATGPFILLLNLIAFAFFVGPIVAWARGDRD